MICLLSSVVHPPIRLTTLAAVGLDTVALIEKHYIAERGLSSEKTTDFLDRKYLQLGKLGNKSDRGGLYPPSATSTDKSQAANTASSTASTASRILVLDIGLSSPTPTPQSGAILEITRDGAAPTLVDGLSMPDGLVVDVESQRMFWTCMGLPGQNDGAVYSANIDGSDCKIVVAPGLVNTPKQLANDTLSQRLYFCDREGAGVFRCGYDGSNLQRILSGVEVESNGVEELKWCIGVAPVPSIGKLRRSPEESHRPSPFSDVKCCAGQILLAKASLLLFCESPETPSKRRQQLHHKRQHPASKQIVLVVWSASWVTIVEPDALQSWAWTFCWHSRLCRCKMILRWSLRLRNVQHRDMLGSHRCLQPREERLHHQDDHEHIQKYHRLREYQPNPYAHEQLILPFP